LVQISNFCSLPRFPMIKKDIHYASLAEENIPTMLNMIKIMIRSSMISQVLLGDMGAGKTSLVLRFVKGEFSEYQDSTIGAAFFTQVLSLNEATIKFDIWDTAGQERYHSLAPMYYRGAAAAIVVYDITSMVIN